MGLTISKVYCMRECYFGTFSSTC